MEQRNDPIQPTHALGEELSNQTTEVDRNESTPTAGIISPCIKVCRLNAHNVCIGCQRTIEEITHWTAMTDAERERVMVRTKSLQADPRSD